MRSLPLRVHPLRGRAALVKVPAREPHLPGAALPAGRGVAPLPGPGAFRVPRAAAVAGEPRRRVVRERAAQGADRGEEEPELGPVRGGPVQVPRWWDHVSTWRRRVHRRYRKTHQP